MLASQLEIVVHNEPGVCVQYALKQDCVCEVLGRTSIHGHGPWLLMEALWQESSAGNGTQDPEVFMIIIFPIKP